MPDHNWTTDDDIIAFDAYYRIQDGENKTAAINRAVQLVNRRTQRDKVPIFNKPGSMRIKMQNVLHLDKPGTRGERTHVAHKTRKVWRKYGYDRKVLAEEMKRITNSFPPEND